MKKKRAWIWVGFSIGLVALLVIGDILANKYVPNIDTQLRALQPVILVSISQPVNGQQVTSGEPIGVFVTVNSAQGLQNVQAYADGTPLGMVMSSPLNESLVTAEFQWLPQTEGWHTFTARVTDLQGRTVVSNAIRVEAIVPTILSGEAAPAESPGTVFGISTDSENLDTEFDAEVDRLIARAGVDLPALLEFPSFPPPASESSPERSTALIAEVPGNTSLFQKVNLWFASLSYIPFALPAAPDLNGSVKNCTVQLQVNDIAHNELGIRLYRFGPNDTAWVKFADLQASPGMRMFEYDDMDRMPGQYLYYASSFNAGGENPGNFFSAEITAEACSVHSPTVVSLQNARLTPTRPVDRLYCYASVNGADWERIPGNSTDFIFPVNSVFDLSPYLHALASPNTPLNLTLECWGWEGGSLVPLGSGGGAISERQVEIDAESYTFLAAPVQELAGPGDYTLNLVNFAPPYYLHYPDSLADCMVHARGDAALEWACENLIDLQGKPIAGQAILVWYWNIHDNCNAQENYCGYNVPPSDVSGFHVYREIPGYEPVLIQTINTSAVTLAVLSPGETASTSAGTRYFVRAFMQDGYESGDSNSLEAIPAEYTMSIPAQYSPELGIRVFKPGGKIVNVTVPADLYNLGEPPEYGIDFGYFRHHTDYISKVDSIYEHAYIGFDLSQVPGTITSARLQWNDGAIHTSGPGNDLYADRCNNHLTDFFGQQLGYYYSMIWLTMDADVTNYVLTWQQNQGTEFPGLGELPSSPGFWLFSGDTSLAYTEYDLDLCMITIQNVRLEVEYIK